MPISHDIVNLKGNSTFSSCSGWNKFLKRFSLSTKECASEDQTLNHNLVNISFFKIDELGLVGKCVKHSFRIYIGCYLQFCITKKLRPVNKNLSKVHFFLILSAHAKGLIDELSTSFECEKLVPNLQPKIRYVLHYRNLQLYLSLGMQLTKVHKVLKFDQTA